METVKVLMRRDGISKVDAIALVKQTLRECAANPFEADEIWMNNLGLEPDYMFEFFGMGF